MTQTTLNRHARRKAAKLSRSPAQRVTPQVALEPALLQPSTQEAEVQELLMAAVSILGVSLPEAVRRVGGSFEFQLSPAIYSNHEELLAQRGRAWSADDVTMYEDVPGVRGLPDRSCYEDAFLAAQELGGRYVEGWAMAEVAPEEGAPPVPVVARHGWVYDPATGGIVESRWEEPATCYFGVVFEDEHMAEKLGRTGFVGMFSSDHLDNYDLLRRGLLGVDYMGKGGVI